MPSYFIDSPKHVYDFDNVDLINQFFGFFDWQDMFPETERTSDYIYEMFVDAAAYYPGFCDPYNGD